MNLKTFLECEIIENIHSLKQIILEDINKEIQYAKDHEGLNSKAGGKCGWFSTYNNCINFLLSKEGYKFANKYFYKKGLSEKDMKQIVKFMYDKAIKRHGNMNWDTAPFVFGDKSNIMGIRKTYDDFRYTVNDMMKKLSGGKSKGFDHHDGFGTRSTKGLSYENVIINEIITFINIICQADKHDVDTEDKFIKFASGIIQDDAENLRHVYYMYNAGALDEIIELCKSTPNLDLTKYVSATGTLNTKRNSKSQIFVKGKFEVNTNDTEKVLEESGRIIADITIKSKTPVYISVKMKDSQLSGVTDSTCFNSNDYFINYTKEGKSFEEFKQTPGFNVVNNFCKLFGIDVEELYNFYITHNNPNLTIHACDEEKLGVLAQKLLGGNYWYVKPGEAVFVPYKQNKKFTVKFSKIYITGSGKGINMKGTLNSVPIQFVFRTDGSDYPRRLFIIINVKDFINLLNS